MKQLLTSAGFATMLLLAACSPTVDTKPEIVKSEPIKEDVKEEINYDSMCIVGERYLIYGVKFHQDNPFEEQTKADVIITAKQNGYVQYCWSWDYKKQDKVLFTRSCKEFVEAMNCR